MHKFCCVKRSSLLLKKFCKHVLVVLSSDYFVSYMHAHSGQKMPHCQNVQYAKKWKNINLYLYATQYPTTITQ
jgi:hypothetical protein